MEKRGDRYNGIFTLSDNAGRINSVAFVLLFGFIFVLGVIVVNAMTVTLNAPGTLTFNGSRSVNFSFTPVWNMSGADPNLHENVSNCSIYTNTTFNTWDIVKNVSRDSIGEDNSIANNTRSYMNFTYPGTSDGNYTWNIACLNYTNSSGATKPTFASSNFTFFLDTVAPRVILSNPVGVLTANTQLNITSNATGVFNVSISDNTTQYVWVVLNRVSKFLDGTPLDYNETINRTMTLDRTVSGDLRVYNFSLIGESSLLNFSSNWTSPGPHGVFFCANDSQGRITCSEKVDYVIKGTNVDDMERMFKEGQMTHPTMGSIFSGLDIRYGNGTDVPAGTFMDPTTGNFTFNMNFSSSVGIYVVGGRIDENSFGNMTSTNYSSETTVQSRQTAGTGMRSNLTWVDIKNFIPSDVKYEFGIIQMPSTFSKVMYCNGTSSNNPGCFAVSQCNASVFDATNHTRVIPTNSACWLTSGSWGGNTTETALTSGFTYLFVDHFSGGLGANDFSQPNVTFNSPPGGTPATNSSSVLTQVINFTLQDINSTGLNLTLNSSINVTIYRSGDPATRGPEIALFNYLNNSSTNLTCITTDTVSPQNTTSVTCNVTFIFNANASFIINVTARDTSNNSNSLNVTGMFAQVVVDQVPPLIGYFNITNSTIFNTSAPVGDGTVKRYDKSDEGSVDQGTIIYVVANWTDNLSQPFQAVLQVYNETASAWVTYNATNQTLNISPRVRGGWSNFTFTVPVGHNLFEGRNVSFRILGNDTLGNVNSSREVINITVQVNDTTVPFIFIPNGTAQVNGTNTSDSTPTISWEIRENNPLSLINVSVDGTTQAGVGEDLGCGKVAIYTAAATGNNNVERHRNGTFTVIDDPDCRLTNGTHSLNITVTDIWSNTVIFEHKFNVQGGNAPGLFFNLSFLNAAGTWSKKAINNTNITSQVGVAFFTGDGAAAAVDKISIVSSCNASSTLVVTNLTVVYPFNESSCNTQSANRTLTVTINDTAGNSNTTVLGFLVDNVGPSLVVHSPTNGQLFSNVNTTINLSVLDANQARSFIGYYLDGNDERIYTLNISGSLGNESQNMTNVNLVNFTAGTHRIKFTANDTLGNDVNSSIITFVQVTVVNFGEATRIFQNQSQDLYNNLTDVGINVSIRVKAAGAYEDINTTNTSADTYEILFQINGSINVSLTDLNGSTANWDKMNFTPIMNDSATNTFIENNWSNTVLSSIAFNNSVTEFATNNNSYYGVVVFPLNLSGITATAQQFWWFVDSADMSSRTNISVCTAAFTSASTTPCWNYTKNGRTIVQVPHFSVVAAVNDSTAPTISITYPNLPNQTVGMFIPNISVSPDTVTCKYFLNGSTANQTMTKTNNVCLGQTERLKSYNSSNDPYNITFFAEDGTGNVRKTEAKFNVSDDVAPNSAGGLAISSSPSTTTATVTVSGANESVNATVFYGTAVGTLTSGPAMETDFNASQTVSLTSLSASTTYHYNVTICDYNGNCVKNGTYNFTTSAAAAAAASSSSSSGGGGGGTVPVSNIAESASKVWDTIALGVTTTFAISKENIAVYSVAFTASQELKGAGLTVAALTKNPLSSSPADATTYQFLEITATKAPDNAVSGVTISFKVPISWVDGQNAKKEDVTLYRYTDGAWTVLPTTYASSDGTYYYYTATTPGFSYFAIGTKKGEAAPTPEETPSTPGQPPAEKPGETPTSTGTQEPAKKSPVGIWIIVAAVALIIVVALAIFRQKRQNG